MNPFLGLNVRMKKPSDAVCSKYGLMAIGEDIAIVFLMADRKKEVIDHFITEYTKEMIEHQRK